MSRMATGVWSRTAGGLKDERDKVDVWISVKFALLSSLGRVSWALQEKGATMETSRYVTEPLRLKTRFMLVCSR